MFLSKRYLIKCVKNTAIAPMILVCLKIHYSNLHTLLSFYLNQIFHIFSQYKTALTLLEMPSHSSPDSFLSFAHLKFPPAPSPFALLIHLPVHPDYCQSNPAISFSHEPLSITFLCLLYSFLLLQPSQLSLSSNSCSILTCISIFICIFHPYSQILYLNISNLYSYPLFFPIQQYKCFIMVLCIINQSIIRIHNSFCTTTICM